MTGQKSVTPQSNQKLIPAVLGLAVRQDDTFLLTQRSQPDTPIWDKKWNIPGGAIDWGETPEEALVREFAEELGVTPAILYPHPVTATALWYGKDTGYDTDAHILLLCYVVDIGDQEIDLTLDPEKETCDWRWFTLEEAKEIETLPLTLDTVKKALALVDRNATLNK